MTATSIFIMELCKMLGMAGEPYTSKGVRTVLREVLGNPVIEI